MDTPSLSQISGQAHITFTATANLTVGAAQFNAPDAPGLLLQSVVERGEKTTDGEIIVAAAVPWFKIVEMMERDPALVHQIDWRKWEEIIAGAYAEQGFEVILTPRSNDKGRDVIATMKGLRIRYFDQVKAYKPGNLVTLDDVHAMLGVLTAGQNVSKGIVTTTSDFAPGVWTNDELKRLMPYRLELKPKDVLLKELSDIAAGRIYGG